MSFLLHRVWYYRDDTLTFFIGLKFSVIYLIWNLTISIVYCVFTAVLGLLIKLYLPKLEYSTSTTVVKQSAAVLINMLATFCII